MFAPLFFLGELFSDMMLALKLFALLSVISFVYSHLGKGPLSYALIGGISWFVLFDYWKFFGGVYVLYTLLTIGVSGILIDFFFVSGMGGSEQPSPVDSSMDLLMRQKQLEAARKMQAQMGGSAATQAPANVHMAGQAAARQPRPRGPMR